MGHAMRSTLLKIALTATSIALAWCSGLARHEGDAVVGIDGLACVGELPIPPAGIVEAVAPTLLDQA